MATPAAVLNAMIRLTRCGVANAPTAAEHPDLVADWTDILAPLSDDQLAQAVTAYLRHPERGRWWPTPADLIAAAGATTTEADDEAAWSRISGARRDAVVALDEVQQRALSRVGGRWATDRIDSDATRASVRRQFLAACKSIRAASVATAPQLSAVERKVLDEVPTPRLPGPEERRVLDFVRGAGEDRERERDRARIAAKYGGDR